VSVTLSNRWSTSECDT